MISLFGLDPATWVPSAVHGSDRTYTETNCYLDIMVELVAATGQPPEAMLGCCAALDFELDQFTFVKPAPEDLRSLYGLDVHEMQPGRDLPAQVAARLAAGQTLVPELDGFHLPDTRGTSYGAEHVKTSVVVEAIDVEAEVLRYFHNATYAELAGADYRAVFRLDEHDDRLLPPYVDVVRLGEAPDAATRRDRARASLAAHLSRRPERDPVAAFAAQLDLDLPRLLAGDLADYHAYAFATVRMLGASAELLASHADWLLGEDAAPVCAELAEVVSGTKVLSFRLARRRPLDVAANVDPWGGAWGRALAALEMLVG